MQTEKLPTFQAGRTGQNIFTLHKEMLNNEQSINIQQILTFFLLSTVFMSNSLIYFFESAGQDGRGFEGWDSAVFE